MGLLGSRKIYVSSVLENLAGDASKRKGFLKTLVAGNIVTNSNKDITTLLQEGIMQGPGLKLRSFYNWAQRFGNYDQIGIPEWNVGGYESVKLYDAPIRAYLSEGTDANFVNIFDIQMGQADISWWAENLILTLYPGSYWAEGFEYVIDPETSIATMSGTTPGSGVPWSTSYDFSFVNMNSQYVYVPMSTPILVGSSPPVYIQFPEIFIYELGVGPSDRFNTGAVTPEPVQAFEDLANITLEQNEGLYPFIPLRLNNQFLNTSTRMYRQAKAGLKKATGLKYDEIITDLSENENLDDIDHAYIMFGVPLNMEDKIAKKYMYYFFRNLMLGQVRDTAAYNTFKTEYTEYEAGVAIWTAWKNGGSIGAEPPVPQVPTAPYNRMTLNSRGTAWNNLNMEISWTYISEETGTGLKKPDAKAGEFWFDLDVSDEYPVKVVGAGANTNALPIRLDIVKLNWQVNATSWRSLNLIGFKHKNVIYAAEAVEITMKEGLTDTEGDSGFLIPLHQATIDDMGLINFTELASVSCNMVVNCYQIVKTGLLGGLLKIISFVIIIVVIIVAPPVGAAGSAGLLGSSAAIGAALGFSGLTALIVGAVANAIAAMLVMSVIQKGAVAIFGEKIGMIIGTIASFAAISVGTGMVNGMTFSAAWSSMMSATNLLQLTSAIGNGVAKYMAVSAQDYIGKTVDVQERYKTEMSAVEQAYADNIGSVNGVIDPLALTDINFGVPMETMQNFLDRTLLTGTDIAQMSLDMLENFASITTTSNLPV